MMSDEAQTIHTLLERGVGEFVVCGGARNAILVAHLVSLNSVKVWRHFEERSAAFFALGRTKETGLPCAVVTTSGSAVAECLPAVIEAHYSAKPLVIVSADRPEEFRGSGSPQVIEQVGIFSEYAYDGEPANWNGWGPWHLNVPLEGGSAPVEPLDVEIGAFNFFMFSFAHNIPFFCCINSLLKVITRNALAGNLAHLFRCT